MRYSERTCRAREAVWDAVAQVEAALDGQPGFAGRSKRAELLEPNAWTMTIWTDAESLPAFVDSPAHKEAMRLAANAA